MALKLSNHKLLWYPLPNIPIPFDPGPSPEKDEKDNAQGDDDDRRSRNIELVGEENPPYADEDAERASRS